MPKVFRTQGECRSASREESLYVASTDGIYKISEGSKKIVEGLGEAVDIKDGLLAYALSGRVYIEGREIEFGSRVLDLSLSDVGLAIAGKRNAYLLLIDGELREFKTPNRTTAVDRLGEYVVVATRDGRLGVYDVEGEKKDEIKASRPFTAVVTSGEEIYVGLSDGGIYKFSLGGEVSFVGEHTRRVFGLDYSLGLFSVGEDRYVRLRKERLIREKKLHFDTYDVAAFEDSLAVVGPRYIRITTLEE